MSCFVLASVLGLMLVPGGHAIPAAVRVRDTADNCGGKCRANFGWPGHHPFGNDPWGLVVDPILSLTSAAAIPTPGAVEAAPSIYSTPSLAPPPVSSPGPSVTSSFLSNSSASVPSPTSNSSSPESSSYANSSSPTPSSSTSPAPPPHSSSSPPSPPPTSSSTPLSSTPSPSPSPPSPPSPSPSPPSPSPSPPSPSPSPSPPPPSSGASNVASGSTTAPTSQSDIQAYLAGHNDVRAQHGAAPLTYSQDLAAKAQQWANGCLFQHSGGALGPLGENLAAGNGAAYGIPEALKSWTDEASQYNAGNPQPSHFTQVVWKGTTQVGCAVQTCDGILPGKAHFYVCEYSPQGNIIGQFAANVQP